MRAFSTVGPKDEGKRRHGCRSSPSTGVPGEVSDRIGFSRRTGSRVTDGLNETGVEGCQFFLDEPGLTKDRLFLRFRCAPQKDLEHCKNTKHKNTITP